MGWGGRREMTVKLLLVRPKNGLDIVYRGRGYMSQLGLATVAGLMPVYHHGQPVYRPGTSRAVGASHASMARRAWS